MRVACWTLAAVLCLGGQVMAQKIDVDNRPVRVDPSGATTPEYSRSIEERNRQAREAAEKAGKTHIDTTFGEFGDVVVKPAGPVVEAPKKPAGAAGAGAAAKRPGESTAAQTPEPAPEYERADEVRQGELRELIGELLKALDRKPEMVRLRVEPVERAERPEAAPPATVRVGSGVPLPAVGAGSGFYGRVVYEVNSDYRGPVLIELLEPPLRGAVVSGRFERVRERLVVRMTRLSWRGRDVAIDAWAVGLDCACYGLSGEVDRHWFERLILPAAVNFADAFLTAKGQAGRRVEVSGETVVDERSQPTDREAVYSGLGQAARSVGQILLQDAPTGPTVRIPRNSEVAVVFARPPGEAASSMRAVAPGSRGPTDGGVVRVGAQRGEGADPAAPRASGAEGRPDG